MSERVKCVVPAWVTAIDRLRAQADALANAAHEFLRECDTPVPDLALRARRRDEMRSALAAYRSGTGGRAP